MSANQNIIHACTLDGKGGGKPLKGAEISEKIQSDELAWVHLDVNFPESREWIEQAASYLDPIILEALLADETRPRIVTFDEGTMIILRGVNLNDNEQPEDMISIRLWVCI